MRDEPEQWRPMMGNSNYAVSNRGRVKRVSRAMGAQPGKIRRPFDNNGYVRYLLFTGERRYSRMAHALVYEAFVGPIPSGLEINHRNGIKTDNRPENLELVTASQNVTHAFRVLGRKQVKPNAKLTWDLVNTIRQQYASGEWSSVALAKEHGVHYTTVRRVVTAKYWAK